MLARRSKLEHPCGAVIDLPRLVPSFTSKGFAFHTKRKENYSDATHAQALIGPFMSDSMLMSAYDIHHRHFDKPSQFYSVPEVVLIDSGGYELSSDFDATEPKHALHQPKEFSEQQYLAVIRKLPDNLPFVIANFDWDARGTSTEAQIVSAQKLFSEFPQYLHSFLMRSTRKRKGAMLQLPQIVAHVGMLRAFHIVGVTEKELGKNLLDRLKKLAELRAAMDREGVAVPIQVWGGLDPILSPLYFFAGAEIFDGVSWLRYAYHKGVAVYRNSYSALELGIETTSDHSQALVLNHNVNFLQRLATRLREFVDNGGGDFAMFDGQSHTFEQAYRTLCTKVPELRGGR